MACGLRLSPGSPLPFGAGPGLIGRRLTKNLLTKGMVCPKSEKKCILREICAIFCPVPAGRSGQKKRNLFGIEPRMEGPKTIFFFTAVAKAAA